MAPIYIFLKNSDKVISKYSQSLLRVLTETLILAVSILAIWIFVSSKISSCDTPFRSLSAFKRRAILCNNIWSRICAIFQAVNSIYRSKLKMTYLSVFAILPTKKSK